MGYFFGLIISVLEEIDSKLRQTTEVIHFDQRTFVSWESEDLPSDKWVSRGSRTLFVKKGTPEFQRIEYPQSFIVSPVSKGIIRKHNVFNIRTSFHGFEQESLFHLVLPTYFVPEPETFHQRPESIIKRQNRIAITWTFKGSIEVDLRLKKVDNKEFDAYKSAGSPIRIRFDNATLNKLRSEVDERAENIVAKALAFYIKEQTG